MSVKSRIERQIAKHLLTKKLETFFEQRGYSDNTLVYPPAIAELESIPELVNKVELNPSPENLDPTTGAAKIGWNLFVMGVNRMYLGHTMHTNLAELASKSGPGEKAADLKYTASQIVEFIIKILERSDDGFERLPETTRSEPATPTNKPKIGPTASGGYYERNRLV
jgi:hypothetical protein